MIFNNNYSNQNNNMNNNMWNYEKINVLNDFHVQNTNYQNN